MAITFCLLLVAGKPGRVSLSIHAYLCGQHPRERVDYAKLRESFTRAVVRRMMTDVPWGVLLSGEVQGLSCITAAQARARGMLSASAALLAGVNILVHSTVIGVAP